MPVSSLAPGVFQLEQGMCSYAAVTMETTIVYLVSTTQKMFKQKFDWPNTTGKSSLTISPRLLGIAAVSQVRITKANNFGLWSQSARMRGALLYTPMTCALHFWNHKRRFIVNLNSHEVLCRSLRCAFSRLAQCLADAWAWLYCESSSGGFIRSLGDAHLYQDNGRKAYFRFGHPADTRVQLPALSLSRRPDV